MNMCLNYCAYDSVCHGTYGYACKRTSVICGFPGIGKSFIFDSSELDCLDSDSSKFDKSKFPQNYIKHIMSKLGFVDYLFVSTHSEVIKELTKRCNLKFTIVYPHRNLKNEYLKRYKERGSDENFIKLMDRMWDKFIDDLENVRARSGYIDKIVLNKGEYLEDIIKKRGNINVEMSVL